jgi:hypothetical protein
MATPVSNSVYQHYLDTLRYAQMYSSRLSNRYSGKTVTGRWASTYNWGPFYRRRNKKERKKGMKRAQFFIRNRMLLPEEIKGIQQGTMEIRRSHILDYDNNRMALLYKNRADIIMGRRLLEIDDDTEWKELTYDIEEPEPKRHFPT